MALSWNHLSTQVLLSSYSRKLQSHLLVSATGRKTKQFTQDWFWGNINNIILQCDLNFESEYYQKLWKYKNNSYFFSL